MSDVEGLAPLAGAQVFVAGTTVGTLTNERGAYWMEGVTVGSATVTVRLIGYRDPLRRWRSRRV